MGAKTKRAVWSVTWLKKAGRWRLTGPHGFWWLDVKMDAVKDGAKRARAYHESKGTPTQLRVKGKNGRIQFEHTYGKDPRKSKG